MKPDKQSLLALILRSERGAPAAPAAISVETASGAATTLPAPVSERLRRRAEEATQFDAWMRELEQYLPPPGDPELDDYYRYALMGVVVGFSDRNLSPYLPQHAAIIPPLLDDIRSVYEQVKVSQSSYSPEEFVYRAFDYGIHKAYYLDWDLYLSHDMY